MNARDHEALVVAYNNTAEEYPSDRTIVDLIETQIERTPDAPALRYGSHTLTYRELNARANQIAAYLRTLGARQGAVVMICMEHSVEVVCAMLGVLKTGAAYAPFDPSTPRGRLALVATEIAGAGGAPPLLLTQSRLAGEMPTQATHVVTLDDDFAATSAYAGVDAQSTATPQGIAYVIFTSGSTGTPKGVMIEHRSLVNYICWAASRYCHNAPLVWPLFSSLAFDLTVTSIYTPLVTGGSIVVYREDAGVRGAVVFKVIDDGVADVVKLTPAHLTMIKDRNLRATRIRTLIVGGEDFKTELARDVTQAFGRPTDIYNEYGPTEATVGCMIHRYDVDGDRAGSVPIGIPGANAGIFVLDEQLRPVGRGVIGEMYISGDGLARGYLNRPDLTEQRFIVADDPRAVGDLPPATIRLYRSGDIARWSTDGQLEFLGRADHQVKVGGARIELGEIEARLLAHPAVRDCVVVVLSATPDANADTGTGIQQLVAYYVTNGAPSVAELREHLAEQLPTYMVPPHFVKLDALPLTTNGKVDRKGLPAPTSENLQSERDLIGPQTNTERALALIWMDMLDVKKVGRDDTFFELGGHSLLAIRVLARIRDVFGLDLPLEAMFSEPTVARLGAALDALRTTDADLDRQLAYWREELAGPLTAMQLPVRAGAALRASGPWSTETFALSSQLIDQVAALAHQEHATLFVGFASGLVALLHRYSAQRDVMLGVSLSARAGHSPGTAFLRAQINDMMSMRTLMHQVLERVLRAYAHPDVPLTVLSAALDSDASRVSLAQVTLDFREVGDAVAAGANTPLDDTTEFSVSIMEGAIGASCEIRYAANMFDAETIQILGRRYIAMLESFVDQPDRAIPALRALDATTPAGSPESAHGQGSRAKPSAQAPGRELNNALKLLGLN